MNGKIIGATLLVFMLIACPLTGDQLTCMASNSDTAATLPKSQVRQNRTGPPSRLLFAVRTDREDRVIYGTDPDMERAMEEQQKLEKEKEEKAWEMLQHMNIYKGNGTGAASPPAAVRPDSSTQK